ncbi:hypothetical protein QFC21_006881 [Naganishia friedmannii]|uniref:Uncharacterized protein n=1 Tax=Naganishia friedmannii TaxID=89922 RepID=A0ACC2UZ78_9TREE|nr:hypothetical protein QFC21_006881 [Naganishia friedmannii]
MADMINTVNMERLKKGEVNLGTSIMAVAFEGGVVLGADSRTTTGSYIANRVTDKLTHIHDRVYCCRSGSAADTQRFSASAPKVNIDGFAFLPFGTRQAVADIVHYHAQFYAAQHDSRPPVHTIASLFQSLCYENKDRLSAGIIVAGWDEEQGGQVYNIPLGGGIFRQPWSIGGSGSTYVYGYCDATYKEGMSEDETVNFVRNTLALAMARDGSSGGCIRMCVITKGGVRRIFVPGNELPKFWEGAELIETKRAISGKPEMSLPATAGEGMVVQ